MIKENNVAPRVLAAITAAATGRQVEIAAAFEVLAPLNTRAEELISDVDLNSLLATFTKLLPLRTLDVIAAMLAYDLIQLQDTMGVLSLKKYLPRYWCLLWH